MLIQYFIRKALEEALEIIWITKVKKAKHKIVDVSF